MAPFKDDPEEWQPLDWRLLQNSAVTLYRSFAGIPVVRHPGHIRPAAMSATSAFWRSPHLRVWLRPADADADCCASGPRCS